MTLSDDDLTALTHLALRQTLNGVCFPSERPRLFVLALRILLSGDSTQCRDIDSVANFMASEDILTQAAAVLLHDAIKQYYPDTVVTLQNCSDTLWQFLVRQRTKDPITDTALRLVLLSMEKQP